MKQHGHWAHYDTACKIRDYKNREEERRVVANPRIRVRRIFRVKQLTSGVWSIQSNKYEVPERRHLRRQRRRSPVSPATQHILG